MDCPNCGQPVEDGAVFCGNCGQQVADVGSPIERVLASGQNDRTRSLPNYSAIGQMASSATAAAVPSYAIALRHPHQKAKIAIACVCCVLGIVCSFVFSPLIGIALGVAGLVLASLARHVGFGVKMFALVFSFTTLLIGIGYSVRILSQDPRLHPQVAQSGISAQPTGGAVTAVSLTTPCYTLGFSSEINIDNDSGSCAMEAFNGATLQTSSNVFKVLVDYPTSATAGNFSALSKHALESDVATNLPGFSITSEGSGSFAGSQAYYLNASEATSNEAVEEATVLHSSATGTAFYVLVHITFGQSTNLSELAGKWSWK